MRLRHSLSLLVLGLAAVASAPAHAAASSSPPAQATATAPPARVADSLVLVPVQRLVAADFVTLNVQNTERALRLAFHIDREDAAPSTTKLVLLVDNSPEPRPFRDVRAWRLDQIVAATLYTSRMDARHVAYVVRIEVDHSSNRSAFRETRTEPPNRHAALSIMATALALNRSGV